MLLVNKFSAEINYLKSSYSQNPLSPYHKEKGEKWQKMPEGVQLNGESTVLKTGRSAVKRIIDCFEGRKKCSETANRLF